MSAFDPRRTSACAVQRHLGLVGRPCLTILLMQLTIVLTQCPPEDQRRRHYCLSDDVSGGQDWGSPSPLICGLLSQMFDAGQMERTFAASH